MGRRVAGISPSWELILIPISGMSNASSSWVPTVSEEMLYSTYINHFTQPDSIIPDQTSPQSWDRYSYVNNNPIRYTDPTGHMMDQGDMGGGSGCSNPKYCRGGKPKPPEELRRNSNPPFATVTPRPTLTSIQSYQMPAVTPSPACVLQQGSSSTPTMIPTSTREPIDLVEIYNDQLDNVEPFAPGLGQAIALDCTHPACGYISLANLAYNSVLYTLRIIRDSPLTGSSTGQEYGTPTVSPTASPTLTRIPVSATPTPTPFFRTPTVGPTIPTFSGW
jgi:hypothetical protein